MENADAKLFYSSLRGDPEGVLDALAQGGSVAVSDSQGFTPLIIAAQIGYRDICALLLAHGSDVNEVVLKSKTTALHQAAVKGHEAVVEALLSWGANVDPQDHTGATPLYLACQEGHVNCVLELLKAGASTSLPNNAGSLPIHVGANQNRVEVVKTLLNNGLSTNMVSSCDFTTIILSPLSWTANQGIHH